MDPVSLVFLSAAVAAGVAWLVTRRALTGADRGPAPAPAPSPPSPPQPAPVPAGEPEPDGEAMPPLLDPRMLHLYNLEQQLRASPEVVTVAELPTVPAFAAMVEHLRDPAITNATLAGLATGDRTYPAWAALHALRARPADDSILPRVYHWLNLFHPWSRELALELLEAWEGQEPEFTGRVLLRLDRSWATNTMCLMALDRFLRRRVAIAPIEFPVKLSTLDEDALDRLGTVLAECEPGLVAPLLLECRMAAAAPQSEGASGVAPERPAAPAPRAGEAGLRYEPQAFKPPATYPRAAFAAARERGRRALHAAARRSVIVSGETGVGKSTLAAVLAAELSAEGWTVMRTSAAELNAGMSYVGQLEGRVRELLTEVRRNRKTVWLVRDVHQLVWTGRTVQNATGVLEMLMPAIESGELVLIGETRPAAAERLLAERPELARVTEFVRLEPPRDEELAAIADAWRRDAAKEAPRLPDALLPEAAGLARHHLGALGSPAGMLRLLELAREAAAEAGAAEVAAAHLLQALAQLTGLPLALLDDRVVLDTQSLRGHFARRVLGQAEAVDCLVDRLALMKAGVASPTRPYAVFLFAGPTGTGKTELVKALAAYLFGSAERMVRVDMSELQDGHAHERLLAPGSFTAGASLAAQVRRQPFSVVLLDEFEKAHPSVWDLFLQVFDDGRLTDAAGDTVDFRNTFIVLTSNLGSKLAAGERLGFAGGNDAFSAREVERAVARAFRPEFVNRLDRIVVFRPLARETMREILRKQVAEAFLRRGLRRRDWAVEIEASALEFLLERGFTPDLGARPLQRALDQYLLAPLARAIVEQRAPEGDQFLFVRADGDRLAVEFVDPDADATAAPAGAARAPRDLATLAWEAHGEPDEIAVLRGALGALEAAVADPAWAARKAAWLAECGEPGFWERPDRFEVLGRAEYMDRVEAGVRSAASLLGRVTGERGPRKGHPRDLVRRLAQQLALVEEARGEALGGGPRDAFIAISPAAEPSEDGSARAWVERLATMYEGWARARGMRVRRLAPGRDRHAPVARLAVSGFAAHARLAAEAGMHVLESGTAVTGPQRATALVRVAPQPTRPASDAAALERQADEALAAGGATGVVRRYREEPSPLVRDLVRGWRTGRAERIWAGDFDVVPAGGDGAGA